MLIDISGNLVLLLMNVRVHAPSDDSLVSVHQCMVSSSELSSALIDVWNMSNNNGSSIDSLKSTELIGKPIKHGSWIIEVVQGFPVKSIANVCIKRDHFSLLFT
jgi:hypothetical protein